MPEGVVKEQGAWYFKNSVAAVEQKSDAAASKHSELRWRCCCTPWQTAGGGAW